HRPRPRRPARGEVGQHKEPGPWCQFGIIAAPWQAGMVPVMRAVVPSWQSCQRLAIRTYNELYGRRGGGDMAFEDLTAGARIREAALAQFAEHGFERTTIRGIARAAGVSPGLLRHHFGSKQELKDAVDAHVMAEIRRANAEVMERS